MYGIWQPKEQCWTSVDEKAAWPTKELAENKKQKLERDHRGVEFEVRGCTPNC